MKWMAPHEITDLVEKVEEARVRMGRGFFWYGLGACRLLVKDDGLTDTGYRNVAAEVQKLVDLKKWRVEVMRTEDGSVSGTTYIAIEPKGANT